MLLEQPTSVTGDLCLLLNFVIDEGSFAYGACFCFDGIAGGLNMYAWLRMGLGCICCAGATQYCIFFCIFIIKSPMDC